MGLEGETGSDPIGLPYLFEQACHHHSAYHHDITSRRVEIFAAQLYLALITIVVTEVHSNWHHLQHFAAGDVRGEGIAGKRTECTWKHLWCKLLQDKALQELANSDLPALKEVQSRLAALYPEYAIAHLPSDAIQCAPGSACAMELSAGQQPGNQQQQQHISIPTDCSNGIAEEDSEPVQLEVDCNQYVANAAVYGDCFQWHLDADPSGELC